MISNHNLRRLALIAISVTSAYAQQSLLQITSPTDRSLVNEGQTITITLAADPSVQNIFVAAQFPLPGVQATSNPNQFTLTLPNNITPGLYQIGAMGSANNAVIEAAPIQIDVERSDPPVYLLVKPKTMTFHSIGDKLPIDVQGFFADGTTLWVTNSSQLSCVSNNTQIVTTTTGLGPCLVTAVGPGKTSVVLRAGSASFTLAVTVPQPRYTGPPPVIGSVTPTSGVPGATQVTVTGANFGNAQGQGYLQIGSRSATSIASWSDGQIVATVPQGSMPGVVMVQQNGVFSNRVPFATAVPSITGISPTSGSQGTLVTISGTNFGSTQGGSTVMFNRAAASPTSWSDSQIVAPAPAGATTGNLLVLVNGTPSNAVLFTAAPNIAGLTPTAAAVGTPVTISGSNFGPTQGASTVTFNGTAGVPTAWSASSVSAPVPAGATSGPVVVSVNRVPSNSSTFQVCQYVSLGVSPSTVTRGGKITVTGTLTSCVSTAQTITLQFTLKGPLSPNSCGSNSTVMYTTSPMTLQPGTSKTVSFPYTVSKTSCTGTYTVVVAAISGGTTLGSSSSSLVVQ
ncbi:MAG TPA: IPT/TIG domain-containing protein [Terriglobales bacterium]|nr:IPT/TIG domain-containing protein [Terriglobales bacterium]